MNSKFERLVVVAADEATTEMRFHQHGDSRICEVMTTVKG